MALSELNRRRWRSFRRNKRAFWSLILFAALFTIAMFAELVANDKPIVVSYRGELYFPVFKFYPEVAFGGDLRTEANYTTPEVQCLIVTGGSLDCWDDPQGIKAEAETQGTALGAGNAANAAANGAGLALIGRAEA